VLNPLVIIVTTWQKCELSYFPGDIISDVPKDMSTGPPPSEPQSQLFKMQILILHTKLPESEPIVEEPWIYAFYGTYWGSHNIKWSIFKGTVAFSIFTTLYNRHFYLSPKHWHHLQSNLLSCKRNLQFTLLLLILRLRTTVINLRWEVLHFDTELPRRANLWSWC
jgi:hypothetical protein